MRYKLVENWMSKTLILLLKNIFVPILSQIDQLSIDRGHCYQEHIDDVDSLLSISRNTIDNIDRPIDSIAIFQPSLEY